MNKMCFGEAIEEAKKGKKIKRRGWNGQDQYVTLAYMESCRLADGTVIKPDNQEIGNTFLMFFGTIGHQCGWLASQGDMLASDWEVI